MSQEWKKQETTRMGDPLSGYQGRPILGQQGPNAKYLGRVIVELWETNSTTNDSNNIAVSAGAVDEDNATFIERIAAALSERVQAAKAQGKRLFE
jgi:hypothetical protein